MAIVVAENLAKSYGSVKAVNGLNLTINEGTITGLIGPNGAGKTTTIKMILGLLKPDKGKVEVFDQNPWDNPEIRPLIGVVHEKAFFPSHQKTQDYLERTCRIFGMPEPRALEVLKLVDLQDARDRQIKALSAGMLQKFSIAHALIHSPKFIIADEMTANLDPQARISLFDVVLQLHKDQNVTFLMSSHILPELSRVCDSVAIMNHGMVFASGKLGELYEKYSAGMIRVSTDKPEELANEIKKLAYVRKVEVDVRGILVQIQTQVEDSFYGDVSRLARSVNAKIQGIETGSASIEELYNRVVIKKGEGRARLEKGKGKPFLEVLSSALHEDYRFPILEVFAFLYVLGTFALVNIGAFALSQGSASGEAVAYSLVSSALSFPLLIFLILILKNIAFGLGSDLEKGIIQTYFSYPLKRSEILSAKLLSAIGVSVAMFLGVQVLALYVLAPGIVLPYMGTVLLTYAAYLSYPLIITSVLLLMAMILRRGALALVIGVVLYFVLSIASALVSVISLATNSILPLQILSIFSPTTILSQYYSRTLSSFSTTSWTPTFSQVLLSVGASYVIAAALFAMGYYYFSRRLNL